MRTGANPGWSVTNDTRTSARFPGADDAVVVGALTTALVASGIAVPTTTLLGIQAAAGAVVVMWGVRTNRRAF